MSAERGASRAVLALSLLASLFLWNTFFDRAIDAAVEQYLRRQQERVAADGPFVYVQDVMRPAAVAGAVHASVWTLPLVAAGVGTASRLGRRSRGRRRTRTRATGHVPRATRQGY